MLLEKARLRRPPSRGVPGGGGAAQIAASNDVEPIQVTEMHPPPQTPDSA